MRASGSPQWSPDGNRIVFDSFTLSRWEIYVADVNGKAQKVVTSVSSNARPCWSRDGRWIYFSSYEYGKEGIYRCPSSGGEATAISGDARGLNPQESFDGHTLFFASGDDGATLKMVPLGELQTSNSEVDTGIRVLNSQLWQLSQDGIYFVPFNSSRSVQYYDFSSRRTRTLFKVEDDFGGGLSISPDHRWILYSQAGEQTGDIMIADRAH